MEISNFKIGDTVYLKVGKPKSGLDCTHWLGPYKVASKENVKLKIHDSKRHPVVNINRLKLNKSDKLMEVSKSIKRYLTK